jgi:hypothetical protein
MLADEAMAYARALRDAQTRRVFEELAEMYSKLAAAKPVEQTA